MNTPSRTVTTLALIQVAVVFGGFLVTRAFVNLVKETGGDWALKYSSNISLLTSSYALWLLAVPLSWTLFFILSSDRASQNKFNPGPLSVGVLITFLLVAFFTIAFLTAVQDATTMRGPIQPMD